MTVVVGGSSPQITFADSTVQNTAALPLTGGSVSADITVHGLTVGLGGGSVSTNTAVGVSALAGNSSGATNTAVGYQAGLVNTVSNQTFVGYQAGVANTSGAANTALGSIALNANTIGAYNVALGAAALFSNTTATYNTAVGYQAGYTGTTATYNTFLGYQSGYSANYSGTTSINCFVGAQAGYYVTTGIKNTIIGSYGGNQGGLDIRTSSNYIVLSDGDGNPNFGSNTSRWFWAGPYTTGGSHRFSPWGTVTDGASIIATFSAYPSVAADSFNVWAANGGGANSAYAATTFGKVSATNRSINAGGSINQNGADYAEYMTKAGNFTINKGDICGIDVNGKLTNVFANAISFVVKSTDPGLVGGDNWFTTPRPVGSNNELLPLTDPAHIAWEAEMETARVSVDRIAFSGQVPVNVTGAAAGQYIVPIANQDGSIGGEAVSESAITLQQYMQSVGKVISVENNVTTIIVKVA